MGEAPTNNPTQSPQQPSTFGPTIEPRTDSPTASPTGIQCGFEVYVYYNQSNPENWICDTQCERRYGEFLEEAIFATYQNLSGDISMRYGEDEWLNQPWSQAGITEYEICMVFNDKIIENANCPSIPNPDPGTGNAEFLAVSRFCAVADENVGDFYDYLFELTDLSNFNNVLDFYLFPILQANPTCCPPANNRRRRRLAVLFNLHRTTVVYPIDTRQNQPLKRYPLPYQGIFTNEPAVTGDITILLFIICLSMFMIGVVCWLCHLECCYANKPMTNGRKDGMALPMVKKKSS